MVSEVGLTWFDYSHFPMETTQLVFSKHITKRMTISICTALAEKEDFGMHLSLEMRVTSPAGMMQVERLTEMCRELNWNCKLRLYSSISLLPTCFIFIMIVRSQNLLMLSVGWRGSLCRGEETFTQVRSTLRIKAGNDNTCWQYMSFPNGIVSFSVCHILHSKNFLP